MSFFSNWNNFLCEIFYNYSYLSHVIVHFGKIFFMRPYIIKRTQSFVHPSVNQSVYMLTLKQKYYREFLRRPRSDFFLNRSRFFRINSKNIFLYFRANYFFISSFFVSLLGTRGLHLLNLM